MARSSDYYLTVAEVMEIIPLGRSAVYELARRYVATGGSEGIPCQRFGRRLLFPVAQIEAIVGQPVDREPTVGDSPASSLAAPSPYPPDGDTASTEASSAVEPSLPTLFDGTCREHHRRASQVQNDRRVHSHEVWAGGGW